MIDYKIVKYCRLCKRRFVVAKGESKKIYCKDCQVRVDRENREMEESR